MKTQSLGKLLDSFKFHLSHFFRNHYQFLLMFLRATLLCDISGEFSREFYKLFLLEFIFELYIFFQVFCNKNIFDFLSNQICFVYQNIFVFLFSIQDYHYCFPHKILRRIYFFDLIFIIQPLDTRHNMKGRSLKVKT
jgi:hypothetical protein